MSPFKRTKILPDPIIIIRAIHYAILKLCRENTKKLFPNSI